MKTRLIHKIKNSTLGKLWEIISPVHKKRLVYLTIALLISAVLNVVGIASIIPFMQILADTEVVNENALFIKIYQLFGSPELHIFLLIIGLGVLIVFVLGNLFLAITTFFQFKYVQSLSYWFTYSILQGYLKQNYEFFLNRNPTELIKNIFSEVQQVTNGVALPITHIVSKGILSALILAFLILVDPQVALVVMGVVGGSYILMYRAVKNRLSKIGRRRVDSNLNRFRIASEAFWGIKQVKLSSREESYLERFDPHAKTYVRTIAKTQIIGKLPKFAFEIVAFGGILAIALVLFALKGSISGVLPLLSLYAFAGYRLMPSLQQVFSSLSTYRSSGASVEILYRDMLDFAFRKNEDIESSSIDNLSFNNSIILNNISYKYPNTRENVINNVDLKIEKNTTVGFVGPTGCGKTTLIDIILGLLVPNSGEYFVDSLCIDHTNRGLWQKHIGYVPQDIYLADDTITRNIAFGVPDKDICESAVQKASQLANIDDFITKELENGYQTIVGERGIRLSGGQRQRIGIARALYHDPDVLVLDEATSALDGKTESAIMDAIHKLSHKKTILMIAHRISTLKDCDSIYVLKSGKIVDKGSFENLYKNRDSLQITNNNKNLL